VLPQRKDEHQQERTQVRKRRQHERIRAPRSVPPRKVRGTPQKYSRHAKHGRRELAE
jgi:hypothetical protein